MSCCGGDEEEERRRRERVVWWISSIKMFFPKTQNKQKLKLSLSKAESAQTKATKIVM